MKVPSTILVKLELQCHLMLQPDLMTTLTGIVSTARCEADEESGKAGKMEDVAG